MTHVILGIGLRQNSIHIHIIPQTLRVFKYRDTKYKMLFNIAIFQRRFVITTGTFVCSKVFIYSKYFTLR